jgi:flagellar motility protein MotE (MotC chaperone)
MVSLLKRLGFVVRDALWRMRERLARRGWLGKLAWIGAGALVLWSLLYYGVGALLISKIDDDTAFAPVEMPEGGSYAVAMAAALVTREIDHGWTANDPFFLPGSVLDNMPNYQKGIVAAISRFSLELTDSIGRSRGTSQIDADLDHAAGLLRYPGDRWYFDISSSWAPTAPSESQYATAAKDLIRYNERMAAGQATFDRRADNLMHTLDRIASDLGGSAADIDNHVLRAGFWSWDADDIFYMNKGKLYAYYMLLAALQQDFAPVMAEKNLGSVYQDMLDSLRVAAQMQPLVVMDGNPDGLLWPSHLTAQGFFLLSARVKLREIYAVLAA